MDEYDISEAKEPPRRKRPIGLVWNILTILSLIAMLCILSVFLSIYLNPNSNLNPFPPPTKYPFMLTPTASVTPRFTLIPSWTPTSAALGMADTPNPSQTPPATESPTEDPSATVQSVAGTPGDYAFMVQQGSPSAISGNQFHPDVGCNWSGVAGQAMSLNGEAVKGIFVQLGGSMPGVPFVDKSTMTGLADPYGPGGFEFTLADKLVSSNGTLWIQLMDQQNLPLSDRIYFNTYDDCVKNLIIIYFTQVR